MSTTTMQKTYDFDVHINTNHYGARVQISLWEKDPNKPVGETVRLLWDRTVFIGHWETAFEVASCALMELDEVIQKLGDRNVTDNWYINGEKYNLVDIEQWHYDYLEEEY